MNARAFAALSLSTIIAHATYATEAPQATAGLRENYVSGLKLISDTRTAITQASDVLALVEAGADTQAARISEMEAKLTGIQSTNEMLLTQGARGLEEGKRLLADKSRIEQRFMALGSALEKSEALLAGATKTVSDLLTAADKSGRLAERRLADQSVEQLKAEAEKLRKSALRLGQMQLRVKLESTLLDGLQTKAMATSDEVKLVSVEHSKLAAQVAKQRAAISALTSSLMKSREQLNAQSIGLADNIEGFRVVQVSVLRHWLLDGPPAGEIPALTITDVIEGEFMKKPMRPTPDMTMFGPAGASARGGAAGKSIEDERSIRGLAPSDVNSPIDPSEASQDVIQLNRRANWYIAMLGRLNSFADESLAEASTWSEQAEAWRGELSYFGTTLASQRGQLSSMQMEQDIISTTVALISKQAETAQAQVLSVAKECSLQASKLKTLTETLGKQSQEK